jgi:hypothetical protein
MARIILGSYMVRYPLGGNLLWALQWLLGLKILGHDVYFVEKAGYQNACFDPVQGAMTDDCTYGVNTVIKLLKYYDLDKKFCFVDINETYFGIERVEIEKLFSSADLFIDMGTHGTWLSEASFSGMRVLVELEPAYTQMKMQNRIDAGEKLPHYDYYYTNGLNIGTALSESPTANILWRHVTNPVIPELFDLYAPPDGAAFTTVMNWQAHDEIEFQGRHYGQKNEEFRKFELLPKLVDVPLELAVSGKNVPANRLQEIGWRLRKAHKVTHSVESYIDYITSSLGEFGVCKNVFVETNSGWFSDRSAAYLASGRPVVIQSTGFEQHFPCGCGLFAVRGPNEAAEAIREIVADYRVHSKAARSIALERLDARIILGNFLTEVGV